MAWDFIKAWFKALKKGEVIRIKRPGYKYYKSTRVEREAGVKKHELPGLVEEYRREKGLFKEEMYVARMGRQLFLVTHPKHYKPFIEWARRR